MKGILIIEERNLKGTVTCVMLDDINRFKISTARCSEDDTYDFETGALIALMKMCGVDKVKKAAKETFFDVAEDSVNEYEEKICALENTELKQQVKKLEKENKDLKVANCAEVALNGKLLKDYHTAQSAYEILAAKSADLMDKVKKLEEENEKLKLDCEKLQRGYIDADIIFCGGRACGKQYKLLVELFKKTPKEKVDAAYKEAYGDRIILCSSHSSTRDELLSLEASKYVVPSEDTFKIKPLTRREQMWENILGASKRPPVDIKVAKQDITSFLRELQDKIPEARWNGSDCPPLDYTNPYWFKHDYIYFALFRYDVKGKSRIYYDERPQSWINKPVIEYIAPMRWDLFLKGRKIVRVTADNVDDFLKECEKNCDIKESEPFKKHLATKLVYTEKYGFIRVYKDPQTNKLVLHFMGPDDLVHEQIKYSNGYEAKKIVDWEDVR